VVEGIGRTGVVAVIKGRNQASGRTIGLRADMDALPMQEEGDAPHRSRIDGAFHGCGHDGHTAMLLGAARYLAETRNFDGTVLVIFQPAEEGGGGGREMVDDGMMDRFSVDEVYGMHNEPGRPVGSFGIRPGPMMAAADQFELTIKGKGGHAAKPHQANDPLLAGAHLVTALQSVVARNVDPLKNGVVSLCTFQAGMAHNVIPDTARMLGTVRSLEAEVRDLLEKRVTEIVKGTAMQFGVDIDYAFHRDYPVTVNHDKQTAFAASVAADVVGDANVDRNIVPVMGGEDFSFMLEARPGAFIFVGNGDTAPVHNPHYNFNDEAIPVGISYWARLVETALPA
ncbi:MAG: M20 aminoacylase family protein, partial [Pseudomonadota bacterium]